jgi:hypothetical protein
VKELSQSDLSTASAAVRDAVQAYIGRVRSVDSWRNVAAIALGRKRLVTRFWEDILEQGTALGFFTIDTATYSYPVIKIIEDDDEDEDEFEAVSFFDDEDDTDEVPDIVRTLFKPKLQKTISRAPSLPEGWEPPVFRDCGHLLWEENSDTECAGCKEKRAPSWRHLKGEFIRPVPKSLRRTKDKISMGGFPGLCCHPSTGLYIGGPSNDCRYTGDQRCEIHA